MKVLLVNSRLSDYSAYRMLFEPLGLEILASALRAAKHDVRILDLQIEARRALRRELTNWQPDAVGFTCNYMQMVPDVMDHAKATKACRPDCFVFIGGHCGSFLAEQLLEHSDGAVDCVLRGEAEVGVQLLLEACRGGDIQSVPGVVTRDGRGPAPELLKSLDEYLPARDLIPARNRSRYHLFGNPVGLIEFSRGCPWDCTFCSAWTFFGRSYRTVSPDSAVRDLGAIEAPNVLIVDDVAFVHPEHGWEVGKAVEKSGIRKRFVIETRTDVMLRHPEVFEYWVRLGLHGVFFGLEAFSDEEMKRLRKRTTPNKNYGAIETAHKVGIPFIMVSFIADPSWVEEDFDRLEEAVRRLPEYVHLHIMIKTPYPGTEIWHTEARKLATLDYRLFDVEHAVLPTTLPLREFYKRFDRVYTASLKSKVKVSWAFVHNLGQMLLKGDGRSLGIMLRVGLEKVFLEEWRYRGHQKPVKYQMKPPVRFAGNPSQQSELYVHVPTTLVRPEKSVSTPTSAKGLNVLASAEVAEVAQPGVE